MTTDKPLDQLNQDDLLQLIEDGVMEGKRIEYKQALGIDNDEGKRKFLASIASFANASGGDLIFGVKAESGSPKAIVPIEKFDSDATKLRLFQMIRDGIEPKVFGVEFKEIPVGSGHVFIVRIPKTYLGVHMVTFNKDHRFYARGANGRVLMDVAEIKSAFTISEGVTDKIRRWRMDRIAKILADETPRDMVFPSRIVLHLMPLCSFDPLFKADISPIMSDVQNLAPLGGDYGTISLDFEGVFCYRDMKGRGDADAYTYAFRNGCVEGAESSLLRPWNDPSEKQIIGQVVECKIIEYLERSIQLLRQIKTEAPFFLGLSYLNVKGFTMGGDYRYSGRGHAISKEHLFVPEIYLESFDLDSRIVLRDAFYMIWNACGWRRSLNYDDTGKWAPQM